MQSPDELLKRIRVPVANWSRKHEGERMFQERKLKRRKCEVRLDGGLLEHERPDVQLHHFVREKEATRRKQDLADARKDAVDIRSDKRTCPKAELLARLSGALVAVEQGLANEPAVTAGAVERYGMRIEHACLRAKACIVRDPAHLPVRMQWVMALRGGVVVQPQFLESEGRRGAAVAYHPAIATPRQVWLSPQFVEKFPKIAEVIQSAAVDKASQWQLLVALSAFQAARARARGNRWSVIAVVAPKELTGGPSELTGRQFLNWCTQVDARRSTLH